MSPEIRVLVADSTRMNSELLSDALSRASSFHIVTALAGTSELMRLAAERQPDVAVLGAGAGEDCPQKNFDSVRELRRVAPSGKSVILVDRHNRETVVEAFRAGARGVFCRCNSISDLCKCICRVHEGQVWASNNEMGFLLDALAEAEPVRMTPNGVALLSGREKQVVRFVAEGMSNREIAEQLRLSEHTIKNYLFRIFDKLGVSNRAELIFLSFSSPAAPLDTSSRDLPELPEGDNRAAFEWCQRGAERFSNAQLTLGEMYRDGLGIERDPAKAYFWFLIAELTSQRRARVSRDARIRVGTKLKPIEIAEAERRAAEWLESHDNRPGMVALSKKVA